MLITTPSFLLLVWSVSPKPKKKRKKGKSKILMGTQNQTTIMWWLLCGFVSLWSEFFIPRTRNKTPTIKPNPFSLVFLLSSPHQSFCDSSPLSHLFLATFSFPSAIPRFHWADPMKEIADFVDPRIRLKHQILMQEYQELREVIEISGFLVSFEFLWIWWFDTIQFGCSYVLSWIWIW